MLGLCGGVQNLLEPWCPYLSDGRRESSKSSCNTSVMPISQKVLIHRADNYKKKKQWIQSIQKKAWLIMWMICGLTFSLREPWSTAKHCPSMPHYCLEHSFLWSKLLLGPRRKSELSGQQWKEDDSISLIVQNWEARTLELHPPNSCACGQHSCLTLITLSSEEWMRRRTRYKIHVLFILTNRHWALTERTRRV